MSVYERNPSTGTETLVSGMRSVADVKALMLELCYPVGSMYISTANVSPATFLGGTWKQHSGYVLRGATSNVTANDSTGSGNGFGGADSVTVSSVASHNHGGSTTNSGAHEHFVGSPSNHSWAAKYSSGNLLSTFAFTPTTVNQAGNYGDNTMYAHSNNIRNSAHTHGINSAGSDYSIQTIPKYKNVYIWERTA